MIAKTLREKIVNTTMYSIADLRSKHVADQSNYIGFVFPVYFQSVPEIVRRFIIRITVKRLSYYQAMLLYITNKLGDRMVHLAYCDNKEKVLEKILSRSKTMIARGAAGRKIPHSRVYKNEVLYFIEKGSAQISVKARIVDVQNYVKLTEDQIDHVFRINQDKLDLSSAQRKRWHKKCLCFVEFSDVEQINHLAFDR